MSESTGDPGALPPLREVIRDYGLAARKSLGQHFLLDLNLTRKIARAAGPLEGETVIEVGPGPGGLTRGLLAEGAARVIAIERDARCIDALQPLKQAYGERLTLVEADALTTDDAALAGGPAKVVSNLPYNVGTPLLVKWLQAEPWPPWWTSLTLMFQKEVADRIVAAPGSKTYGRLSVLSQWRTRAVGLFDVPASAFTPPPKVTSSIIQITPRPAPLSPADPAILEAVTAAAFGKRRKMLRSALKPLGPDPIALLAQAGLEPTARGEDIDVSGFCRLARAYEEEGFRP